MSIYSGSLPEIFFTTYNENIKDWDRGWYAAVNCGDTFYYACADATELVPGKEHEVRVIYEKYGWDGVVAWCAIVRNEEPLKELQTEKYFQAYEELRIKFEAESNRNG